MLYKEPCLITNSNCQLIYLFVCDINVSKT